MTWRYLVYLDITEAIQGFMALGKFIVFFLYLWLSWDQAGPMRFSSTQ